METHSVNIPLQSGPTPSGADARASGAGALVGIEHLSPPHAHASAAQSEPLKPILTDQWPALAAAMSRYHQRTAEDFTRLALSRVESGLIRHDHRRVLAAKAHEMGIRPFDAQLLIACAVRQWALQQPYDPTPTPHAPALSPEYQWYKRAWLRFAIVAGTAAALDIIIIYNWIRG